MLFDPHFTIQETGVEVICPEAELGVESAPTWMQVHALLTRITLACLVEKGNVLLFKSHLRVPGDLSDL